MTDNNNSNELAEDYLEIDDSITGQHFFCLSVINPETTLKRR